MQDLLLMGKIRTVVHLVQKQSQITTHRYSHHFLARQEAEEKAEEEKKKAAEADAIQQRAANRELYFRPRSQSSQFVFHDSRTNAFSTANNRA